MRKLISVLLISVMAVSLPACSASSSAADATVLAEDETDIPDSPEETSDIAEEEEKALKALEALKKTTDLKILFVSSTTGIDDGNFNQNSYKGVTDFIEEYTKCSADTLMEETGRPKECRRFLEENISKYDVIVCAGYLFARIGEIAEKNPSKYFILIDSDLKYTDGSNALSPNVYAMTFSEEESGFLAGVSAAMETKSGKVAIVTGIPYASNVNYQYGFMSGVKYVNETQRNNVKCIELEDHSGVDANSNPVGGNYVGAFNDPDSGKKIAEELIAEGVDIIFVAAGESGNGVFDAIKEADGVMAIGCDVDQYDLGKTDNGNIVLTSVIKRLDLNVKKQLENIAAGKFMGGNFILDATSESTGYVGEDGRHQLSETTLTALSNVYKLLKSGSIVPASYYNGITPETFSSK